MSVGEEKLRQWEQWLADGSLAENSELVGEVVREAVQEIRQLQREEAERLARVAAIVAEKPVRPPA